MELKLLSDFKKALRMTTVDRNVASWKRRSFGIVNEEFAELWCC